MVFWFLLHSFWVIEFPNRLRAVQSPRWRQCVSVSWGCSDSRRAKQNCRCFLPLSTAQHFLTAAPRNKTPSIFRNCVHASVFTLEGHTSIYGKMADSASVICSALTMPQTFSREDNCQQAELMFPASTETVEGWWNSSFSPFLSSLTRPDDEHFVLLQREINHAGRWIAWMRFLGWYCARGMYSLWLTSRSWKKKPSI